ncbi:MAG TPA: riboflavin synthase [Terricaulis sp.]|nr:riboflavin synthase [Terricaulis sp.]
MFTGIVTALGGIEAVERSNGLVRLTIAAPYDADGIEIGASIAHDGVCLTVVEKAEAPNGARYVVEAAPETLAITTVGDWDVGGAVNLERALKLGDELGGHIVQGHVDGLGEVISVAADGAGWRVRIAPPESIAFLIAPKGAITVNGVSLTVNEVDAEGFGVLVIPHTWAVTTLSKLTPGDKVNLEADMMARYAARLMEGKS